MGQAIVFCRLSFFFAAALRYIDLVRHLFLISLAISQAALAQAPLPTEWIDPDTGHRVIRLSRDDGTQSLYFHQNAYTADGKKLIVTTAGGGIATINLATREVKPLVPGPGVGAGRRATRRRRLLHQAARQRRLGRGDRLRHQRQYRRHTRGGEAAARPQRRVAQCR